MAGQIGAEKEREDGDQHHFKQRYRNRPLPRVGQDLLEGGEVDAELDAAKTGVGNGNIHFVIKTPITDVVDTQIGGDRAAGQVAAFNHDALLCIEKADVGYLLGGEQIAGNAVDGRQVIGDYRIARTGRQQAGRDAEPTGDFILIRFLHLAQQADAEYGKQDAFDQGDTEDSLGTEFHGLLSLPTGS